MFTVVIVVSYVLVVGMTSGWFYSFLQAEFPDSADTGRRFDVTASIVLGLLSGLILPIGLLMSFCLTNFADDGWWKSYKD